MKFAKREWVRTQEMKITQIIKEYPMHPVNIKGYCAGCHASLSGQPWAAVWAKQYPEYPGGAHKLCASCTAEARQELEQS
jgi:hypothetical protein